MNMHEQGVAGSRIAGVCRTARFATIGFVDGVSVLAHPLSNFLKNANRLFRNGAISSRTDTQKIISTITRAGDEITNHRSRVFLVVIGVLVSPAIVKRHAGLPRTAAALGSNMLFRRREVALKFVAVVHDDLRL